jgi:disulfide oxidoreductase YuzD
MRYGSAVEVEYVDMGEPEAQSMYSELLAVIEDRDLPYPLVAIDGQLRLAGTAHFFRILPLVEEAFEGAPIS